MPYFSQSNYSSAIISSFFATLVTLEGVLGVSNRFETRCARTPRAAHFKRGHSMKTVAPELWRLSSVRAEISVSRSQEQKPRVRTEQWRRKT